MNKFKLIAVLALVLSVTGCAEDKYVSVRHPENEASVEVTDETLDEEESTESEDSESIDTNENPEKVEVTDEMLDEDFEDSVYYTVESTVNVRTAPSETSEIMTQVSPGDDVIKLGDSDNWSRVTINGQTGYIRSDLLKAR